MCYYLRTITHFRFTRPALSVSNCSACKVVFSLRQIVLFLSQVFQNLGELLNEVQIDLITEKFATGDRINYKDFIAYLLS